MPLLGFDLRSVPEPSFSEIEKNSNSRRACNKHPIHRYGTAIINFQTSRTFSQSLHRAFLDVSGARDSTHQQFYLALQLVLIMNLAGLADSTALRISTRELQVWRGPQWSPDRPLWGKPRLHGSKFVGSHSPRKQALRAGSARLRGAGGRSRWAWRRWRRGFGSS